MRASCAKEWIRQVRGQFDMGLRGGDREQTLDRQKEPGIVRHTQLPPVHQIGTPETRNGPRASRSRVDVTRQVGLMPR